MNETTIPWRGKALIKRTDVLLCFAQSAFHIAIYFNTVTGRKDDYNKKLMSKWQIWRGAVRADRGAELTSKIVHIP